MLVTALKKSEVKASFFYGRLTLAFTNDYISLRVASPSETTDFNFSAASEFSASNFCKEAACNSAFDSSEGKESINNSISFAVLAINCENKLVWSSFGCCCCLLPNGVGFADCCKMPKLFVKLSACCNNCKNYNDIIG